MTSPIESALRAARVEKLNLFRNKTRGGYEAAVSRDGSGSTFSIGIDDDPVEAILKALSAAAPAFRPAAPKGEVAKSKPTVQVAPAEASYSGGIFG